MADQQPSDVALTVAGALVSISSLTTWIRVSVIGVTGMDSWWGFVALVSGVFIALYGATRAWPGLLDSDGYRKNAKNLAIAGCIAALGVLSYVGIRVADLGRQFDKVTTQDTTDTSGLGEEFQSALDDFQQSIKDAMSPSLAFGWYLGMASAAASTVLVVRSRKDAQGSGTDQEFPPPASPN